MFDARKQSVLAVLVAMLGHVTVFGTEVVDLTHVVDNETLFWPGNPAFNFTILARASFSSGSWLEMNAFQTAEHGGTHLDAPAHFAKGKLKAHEIPMKNLVGPGVIVNVKSKIKTNPDYRVSVTDLLEWESRHGLIPEGAIVIMNSGWSSKYPNKTLTFGSLTPDNTSTFHFPGWHEDSIYWLLKNRIIHVVGVDTPSTDYGQTTSYPVHKLLSNANISGVENVANLDAIPESGSIISIAAIKLYDGSGGPARVFATYNSEQLFSAGHGFSCSYLIFVFIFLYCLFEY